MAARDEATKPAGLVTVAATQMVCVKDWETNISRAEVCVREAAAAGADVILLQELW